MKYAEFNPLFTGASCANTVLIAAEKLNFENFNDAICASRKYFRKSCLHMKYAEFSPLFTGINCAYILLIAAEKLNFENFNDVIRAYRKYFWKKIVGHDRCRIQSSIHWRKLRIYTVFVLFISAEKLNFEYFKDAIRAYRKYFRKRCLHTKYAEFNSVLTATNRASIKWAVIEIFAF